MNSVKKSGASAKLLCTLRSAPNASQMTKAVLSGSTAAASSDAPTRPMAKSCWACTPASGASAEAACCAESTPTPASPCGYAAEGRTAWPRW